MVFLKSRIRGAEKIWGTLSDAQNAKTSRPIQTYLNERRKISLVL